MPNAGLGEFCTGGRETVPCVKAFRVGPRVQHDPLETRASRNVDQPRQDRAAYPAAAPRAFDREAPDAAVGQQPAAADGCTLIVVGDDVATRNVATIPFEGFGNALLEDEHLVANPSQPRTVAFPIGDAHAEGLRTRFDDIHLGSCGQAIEKLDDAGIAHADAAVRGRNAERRFVARAMNIDLAPQRVDGAAAVEAALASRKPKDPRQHPVAVRMFPRKLRSPDFSGRPAPDEYGVGRTACADLRAHDVQAARSALAAVALARAILRRRYRIRLDNAAGIVEEID